MTADNISIRMATEADTPLILKLIQGLADYEKMSADVEATEEELRKWLFEHRAAEVLIASDGGEACGFALFFSTFSTFVGRPCLYLEDLFIFPQSRGKGIGRRLLSTVASIAAERGCGRLEWECLDWNEPSIGFYKQMGAVQLTDRRKFRLNDKALKALATRG